MITQFRPMPDAGARIGPDGERSYKRTYNVRSNTPDELRAYILNYALTPLYGSPHPEDWTCTVSSYDLQQLKEDPYHWTLEVTWATGHNQGRNEQDDQAQPDQRRPRWSARFQPISNFLPVDRQGNKFCDSAGTPFDPIPDQPIWVRAITIVRYENVWSENRDLGLINACNSDAWRGSAAKTCLISDIQAQEVWLSGNYWFEYTYQILQNPFIALPGGMGTIGGWDPLQIVDAGPKILKPDPVSGQKKPIAIVDSQEILDGRANIWMGPAICSPRARSRSF